MLSSGIRPQGNRPLNGNRFPAPSQAFTNLIENALRYAREETTVRVFPYGSDQQFCTVCVQNIGLPIPEDERESIFEPLYRSAVVMELVALGSGLGLTTARRIVRMHHGDIRVQSSPSREIPDSADVRFYVELPVMQALDAEESHTVPASS